MLLHNLVEMVANDTHHIYQLNKSIPSYYTHAIFIVVFVWEFRKELDYMDSRSRRNWRNAAGISPFSMCASMAPSQKRSKWAHRTK